VVLIGLGNLAHAVFIPAVSNSNLGRDSNDPDFVRLSRSEDSPRIFRLSITRRFMPRPLQSLGLLLVCGTHMIRDRISLRARLDAIVFQNCRNYKSLIDI
jgi:hypothetical protein